MRKLIILIIVLLVFLGIYSFAEVSIPQLQQYFSINTNPLQLSQGKVKVVTEESVTIDTVKKVGPSVVTVEEMSSPTASSQLPFNFGPFPFFGPGQSPFDQGQGGNSANQPQAIGSGFIVTNDGLIVTNKHVVSDAGGTYKVITSDDKTYDVKKIYRDPLNDIAILQIDPSQNPSKTLQPAPLGDSSKLQVGQFAIAIGTALGEFRNTVTTGVISGLGRGITAGDEYAGAVENLSDVIQTSAAINPGNSGGPLLNSSGQVIGVNTAVSSQGQNIGFAMPINTIKSSLQNFNQTGQFNRPYLGVEYKMISQDLAIANGVPQGAYIASVVSGSPAEKAGLQQGDIITKLDGQRISGTTDLATIISKKKVGDSLSITYWRNNKSNDITVPLGTAPSQ